MNAYVVETPRPAIALCALALCSLTFGALVVAPAAREGGAPSPTTLARAAAPAEVAISPARIDVIAIRTPNVAWALADEPKPNCKPEV